MTRMFKERKLGIVTLVIVCIGIVQYVSRQSGAAQTVPQPAAAGVPFFQVDPRWPRLPVGSSFGVVSSVAVDRQDHVWVLQRPRLTHVPSGLAPVVELDANGKFVQGWGGPGAGYDWPYSEHGIAIDDEDNVWITGNNPYKGTGSRSRDDMLLKFTKSGKFLLQIGGRDVSQGNADTKSVKTATDVFVYKGEVFVSDGYGNRRIVVFDAGTGAFKRMWGAFGNAPEDVQAISSTIGAAPATPSEPASPPVSADPPPPALISPAVAADRGPGPQQFSGTPHGIKVSNDGYVYVADRGNRRIQVFTTAGKYVKQGFVNRQGPFLLTVAGIAFSPDPAQQFLYAVDFHGGHIVVLDRQTLETLYSFAIRGRRPGDLLGPHNIASDSKGNLYVAEVEPGNRAQKFAFKGIATAK